MHGGSRRRWRVAVVASVIAAVSVALAWLGLAHFRAAPDLPPVGSILAPQHDPPRRSQRVGGLDVTFIVASDTHFGFESGEHGKLGGVHDPVTSPRGVEAINLRKIRAMNGMPGIAWPSPLDGTIGRPRGVLISGDLTEDGKPWEWRHFVQYYGLRGGDGLLDYPVFEGHGNHDKHHGWYVLERVRERHGGTSYAFDWDDLHLVNLGEAPDDDGLDFLESDLASVGRERPVVVYFHFPLMGPYSDTWFAEGDYQERFLRALEPYNVVGIFHGHYHRSGRYTWHGYDVYNVGAAKHGQHSFAVVQITDERFRVASYQHGEERFEWWHEKPIHDAPGEPRFGGVRDDRGMMFGE